MGFDFALRRHHQATDRGLNASYYEMEADYESIVRKEEKGLGARQKKTFEFELQIPTEDPPIKFYYNSHIEKVPESQRDIVKSFSPTVKSALFKLDYFVMVWVYYS